MSSENIIRLMSVTIAQVRLATDSLKHPIPMVIADGVGQFDGQKMVQIGERDDETENISTHLEIPQELMDNAVYDEAIQEKYLRRGEVVIKHDKTGLWVPLEKVGILVK